MPLVPSPTRSGDSDTGYTIALWTSNPGASFKHLFHVRLPLCAVGARGIKI